MLGADAGPSKLAAIKKHGLPTLDEDGFLNLIATRVPDKNDGQLKKKLQKEANDIKKTALEMESREKQASKSDPSCVSQLSMLRHIATDLETHRAVPLTSQLWTARYAPRTLKEICGNKGQVEKLQLWLHEW